MPSTITKHLYKFSLLGLLAAGLVVAGCDTGVDAESVTQITGQVTDNSSYGGEQNAEAPQETHQKLASIEGAVVTAARVAADGSTTELDGQATTDTEGNFSIEVSDAPEVVLLKAEGESDFESGVLVYAGNQSSVQAAPMTSESHAETKVYVEVRSESSSEEHVTAADVAAYVDANTAADIEAGATSAANVAAAIHNAVEAEAAYHSEESSEIDAGLVANAKKGAYAQLQASLATAADASARAEAIQAFEATLASLYAEAGASAQTQAEGRQAGTSLVIEFSANASSDAELGLRKKAELLRAYATAQANEAVFEAEGAAQASLDALADARNTLISEIRAATSVEAIIDAKASYKAAVKDELETSFDVDASMIVSAEESTESAFSALEDAFVNLDLLLGNAIEASVNAYSTFYAEAQSAAETALEASADAEACATVIVTLEAF